MQNFIEKQKKIDKNIYFNKKIYRMRGKTVIL